MSKRSRALEEKYRGKVLKPWERPTDNIIQDELKTWSEIAKAHYHRTRSCTIQDIKDFIANKKEMAGTGYWITTATYWGKDTQPVWEVQIEELYRDSHKIGSKGYMRTWDDTEADMISLWKAKYTKLGRILS